MNSRRIIQAFILLLFHAIIVRAIDLDKAKSASVALLLAKKLQVQTPLNLTQDQVFFKNNREFHQIEFLHPSFSKTQILISGPKDFWQGVTSYPVLFVMSGFQTGAQSLALIGNPEKFVLIGYQYPYTAEEMILAPERLGQSFLLTIGQNVGIWKWLMSLNWVDKKNVSVLGVSLGSVFLPVSLRVAQFQGFIPRKTIFAFGGAEITSVINNQLRDRISDSSLEVFHQTLEVATNLLAPKTHLPYLKGKFLVVRGLQDEVFPKESGELLEQLLPEPKTLVRLNTKHINVDTPDIIAPTIQAIYQFIIQDLN